MATAVANFTGSDTEEKNTAAPKEKVLPGVMAGVEVSFEHDYTLTNDKPEFQLSDLEVAALREMCRKAAVRDTPARLIEVIQAWEAPLDVLTPIPTPCGWKTMGSLRTGDYVFGSNGRIASVTHLHPIQEQKSYSIFFSDGTSIIAGEKHSWMTTTCKERSVEKQDKERTTKELFETQDRQHAIRMMPGLQTFDTHLPIDPYMLGCWLGDGIAKTGEICGGETDLAEIISHSPDARIRKKVSRAYGNYCLATVKGLRDGLYRMGLLDNKRIPEIYLRASFEQRLALLQGLMDTDGWATSNGGCGWGQFKGHRALIDGFSELLSSLGIKHQFYAYQRKREDGEPFEFWQTTFYSDLPCFRLQRKANRQTKRIGNRSRLLYITGVEEVGIRNVRCITVDTPDHLFLAGKSMVPTHNCLFYRGFQFLYPLRGGGWKIPGESSGYGPSMQLDLSLLPSNIYSSYAQIVISSLTRSVPKVRFQAQDGSDNSGVTGAQSGDKYLKVIYRNIDPIVVQTDAARYLWCDGRFLYWSRYVLDGQKFGWKEEDEPDDIVPENEPSTEEADAIVTAENEKEANSGVNTEETPEEEAAEGIPDEEESAEEFSEATKNRTPNGQEVRTAHGKLEVKLVPMMANNLDQVDALDYETEVDICRAKAMFPNCADDIRAGDMGFSEAGIAKLARQNVKLGMQSSYITSDSASEDVTIRRTWFRPSAFMWVSDEDTRNSLIAKFPDGVFTCYAGDHLVWARNESINRSWALGQAYSGDGQNRNALGTSLMPIQKRINNWLDLMNDYLVRGIPKIWMDNKAFNVDAIRNQTNVPGDRASFKRQGIPVDQLVWQEPKVEAPLALTDFIKDYRGPFAELVSGGYPALAGGQTDTDTFRGMALQRDQALGRLGPTWHQIQCAEAQSGEQLVWWGSKMRKGTINERIPGGEVIRLEANDLKSNIACYAEADENFPESYPQKQQRLMGFLEDTAKNPAVAEVFYNAANLDFVLSMVALPELYIPQVVSYKKQMGEIELLAKTNPVPNPQVTQAEQMITQLEANPAVDQTQLVQAKQELQQLQQSAPFVSSIMVDAETEDNDTEAAACWRYLMEPEGRKLKKIRPKSYQNIRLHFLAHQAAAQQKAANAAPPVQKKPPSLSVNWKDVAASGDKAAADQILGEGGIQASPTPQASPGVPSGIPPLPGPGTAGPPMPSH